MLFKTVEPVVEEAIKEETYSEDLHQGISKLKKPTILVHPGQKVSKPVLVTPTGALIDILMVVPASFTHIYSILRGYVTINK